MTMPKREYYRIYVHTEKPYISYKKRLKTILNSFYEVTEWLQVIQPSITDIKRTGINFYIEIIQYYKNDNKEWESTSLIKLPIDLDKLNSKIITR